VPRQLTKRIALELGRSLTDEAAAGRLSGWRSREFLKGEGRFRGRPLGSCEARLSDVLDAAEDRIALRGCLESPDAGKGDQSLEVERCRERDQSEAGAVRPGT
jgi:hypothetical protein